MTNFVTTFFIVLGAYLVCLLAFSVVKYVIKRKDEKNKQNKEGNNEEDKKDD